MISTSRYEDCTWAATATVLPGTYFTLQRRWHLCVEQAQATKENTPYPFAMKVATSDGAVRYIGIYAHRLRVAEPGTRPDAFNPASMRRRAKEDEERAEGLLNLAGARRRLANKIEHGAQIQ